MRVICTFLQKVSSGSQIQQVSQFRAGQSSGPTQLNDGELGLSIAGLEIKESTKLVNIEGPCTSSNLATPFFLFIPVLLFLYAVGKEKSRRGVWMELSRGMARLQWGRWMWKIL